MIISAFYFVESLTRFRLRSAIPPDISTFCFRYILLQNYDQNRRLIFSSNFLELLCNSFLNIYYKFSQFIKEMNEILWRDYRISCIKLLLRIFRIIIMYFIFLYQNYFTSDFFFAVSLYKLDKLATILLITYC